ncbi:GntR family transcriptional regulator [Microlunatus soli]|uniref:GntR family transcriptional regulator n=1 Tax=Microlunatus soli TaxID=630515 RepID=A0A1H1MES9_9ACTN|nr:GntR family transcriptional regulator [Microlunatus soli]SDR85344.1 GntR family transcriptional regulator [Microlunatus soli]
MTSRPGRGPLYRAIQSEIQRDILNGTLKPGDWLPSESQLRARYGVSQTSVRRAFQELQRLGLVERFHGRGSIVASNEIRAMSPMLGLGRELRHRGFTIRPELLSNAEQAADEEIAGALDIPVGATVVHIERRYWIGDDPFVFLDHHLTPQPGIDFTEFTGDSLYAFLTVRDAQPTHAHERVSAVNLSAAEAEQLTVEPGTAAMLRQRTSFGADQRPTEFTRYILRGDLYHLDIDLRNEL